MHRQFLSAHKTQIFKDASIKDLPHVQMKHLVYQFVPIVPCLIAEHHWEKSGPSSDTSFQTLKDIDEVPSQVSLTN